VAGEARGSVAAVLLHGGEREREAEKDGRVSEQVGESESQLLSHLTWWRHERGDIGAWLPCGSQALTPVGHCHGPIGQQAADK
jgi:hypothetical protein